MKRSIKLILKILLDVAGLFLLSVLGGILNNADINNYWLWISSAAIAIIGGCFSALLKMKIGKGERATYSLKDQMIDYYLKKKNFITLTFKVCEIELKESKNQIYLTFEIDEAIDIEYRLEGEKTFVLVYQDRYNMDINNGDVLTFTTAPQKYYNKHILPILSLHKDDEEIVSIKEGIDNYIAWIFNNIN